MLVRSESEMVVYPGEGFDVAFFFAALVFFLVLGGLVAFAAWKIVATRRLAQRNGASDADATTLAFFGGTVGTAAAYLKPAVAGCDAPAATTAPTSREQLITEVRALEAKGLITPEQAERRVDEILRIP